MWRVVRHRLGVFAVVLGLLVCPVLADEVIPTEAYAEVRVAGWLVRMAPGFRNDTVARDRALTEIARQLGNIATAVPEPALSRLRQTVLWVEYRPGDPKQSDYHRSAKWLAKNGFNPDKAQGIELDQDIFRREFSAPWSLMHELTHAYFDRVLNREAAALEAAYLAAVQTALYDDVLRNTGRRQKAYAMNSVSEYYAELSEAYFGVNDFEPFDRAALRAFDPKGFAAVETLWSR